MNRSFEQNIQNIYGNKGQLWLSQLDTRIAQLEAAWNLDHLTPHTPLSYNYILKGFQNQLPIIVKLSLDEVSLEKEIAALQAFKNYGAVSLIDYQKDALLLQGAIPGTSLKNHPNAIEITCHIIQRLNQAKIPAKHTFPHIRDWLEILEKPWGMPPGYLEKARIYKSELLKYPYPEVLLHGDLHLDNIILHEKNWAVIDPKGVIGFPINELWAGVQTLDDLIYMAHFFEYPLDQVRKWYYVHLILAACWQLEDQLNPKLFLNLASKL